jgi:hypothetical protein
MKNSGRVLSPVCSNKTGLGWLTVAEFFGDVSAVTLKVSSNSGINSVERTTGK